MTQPTELARKRASFFKPYFKVPACTVNAIAPGAITWPSFYRAEQREAFLALIPLQRAGLAEECAAAVVFLARDATYCTGQVIRIDGGRA